MKRTQFIETFTRSGGFSVGQVPPGCIDRGHTTLFRSEPAPPIGVCAYKNCRSPQIPSKLYIEVHYADETFVKEIEVDSLDMLDSYFDHWVKERDGVNSPAEIAANMAALDTFQSEVLG